MADKAIQAAHDRLKTLAAQMRVDAHQLHSTLIEAKRCGIDTRVLDFKTIEVRFLDQLPAALEKKAAALLPPVVAP